MGIFAYMAICVLWGLSSPAAKLGLENIDVFTFSFFRFLTTGSVLLLYNILRRKSIYLKKQDLKVIVISATVMFFMNSMMTMLATKRLDAGLVPIVLSLVPVVMVIMESVLQKKLLVGYAGIAGMFGGILGIAIISFGGGRLGIDPLGLGFLAAGIMCWSSGSIYLKRKRIEASTTVLLMYQAFTPLLYYGAIVFASGGPKFHWDPISFGGMFYIAIADTIIGTSSYIYLLKHWKMPLVATYAYINPIVGLFGAYILLGESISAQKLSGMAVILFSVFLIQFDETLRKKLTAIIKKEKDILN